MKWSMAIIFRYNAQGMIHNSIKIKIFCTVKDNVKWMRRQPIDWEKIFSKDIFNKRLYSKIHRELLRLSSKKIDNQ